MPRASGRQPYIKIYPLQCLSGSIRYQLDVDERSVWYDLLCFAAICSQPGVISDSDGRAHPHNFIANRLNIPLDLLERTLKKCITEGRISENSSGIKIVHWADYQSEYQRQKPYRESKKEKYGL